MFIYFLQIWMGQIQLKLIDTFVTYELASLSFKAEKI